MMYFRILLLLKEKTIMTVTKEFNGKWRVDISNGYITLTSERNRHRKSGFKTRKEAEEYEVNFRVFNLNQVRIKDRISISYLYKLLKEEDKIRGNKRGTVGTQESYFNCYASKFFKNADMKLISTSKVKSYRDCLQNSPNMKRGGLSNSHINQQMIFIHKLFELSISKRIRQDNPCDALRKLPKQHKGISYYIPEQFKIFDSCFTDEEYRYQLLYRVLMFTGARLGETLALNWNNVNLAENYIDIVHSAYYRKNQVHIEIV